MKISKQVIFQGLQQLFGVPYIYLSHGFRLPNETYCSKTVYQLPFEGEWTVINGGIQKEFSHSWNIPTQRYAYDFLMINPNGKTFVGDEKDVRSYACYDKIVLSPADGEVVEIGNQCEDSPILLDGMMEATAKDIRGNYILIKHANNEYGFLGHLKPGSILVTVGQKVRCGEPIAKCGNTGNSSEPHLHFHVQERKGFFTSAGLPIQFRNIKAVTEPNFASIDKRSSADIIIHSDNTVQIGRGQKVNNI